MSLYIFDTGPLSAFARVARLDVLRDRCGDQARWTVEVRDEIDRGLPAHVELAAVATSGMLDDPIRMTDPIDLREIELVRWALGGGESRPERHRGEAATIVAAQRLDAVAVLDDHDARTLANRRSIPIIGTEGILRSSAIWGIVTWEEAWDLFQEMRQLGVRLRDLTFADFHSG